MKFLAYDVYIFLNYDYENGEQSILYISASDSRSSTTSQVWSKVELFSQAKCLRQLYYSES